MGRIFWNLIARTAFLVGFITASAHAIEVDHTKPKGPKAPSRGLSTKDVVYKHCMPGPLGIVCQGEPGTPSPIISCADQPPSLLRNVRRNGNTLSAGNLNCVVTSEDSKFDSAPNSPRRGSLF